MKILTICSAGTCRSVALAHRLKMDHGHDAVPVGADANSPDTIHMLACWADAIITMQPQYALVLEPQVIHKLIPPNLTDVGSDIWSNPLHHDLQRIIKKIIATLRDHGYVR